MASGALPDNPFVAAEMIEDPSLFVGRKDELHAIASRMKGDQPTSINIVGDKHIGKSLLLASLFISLWEQRRILQKISPKLFIPFAEMRVYGLGIGLIDLQELFLINCNKIDSRLCSAAFVVR